MKEKPKESVINEIITDEIVLFQWDLIMHDIDIPVSNTYRILLHCGLL